LHIKNIFQYNFTEHFFIMNKFNISLSFGSFDIAVKKFADCCKNFTFNYNKTSVVEKIVANKEDKSGKDRRLFSYKNMRLDVDLIKREIKRQKNENKSLN
jgi:hypothetical protein